jgi:Protein of unknown function (DUF3124)
MAKSDYQFLLRPFLFMKRHLFLRIAIVLIFLTSCSLQDIDPQSKAELTAQPNVATPSVTQITADRIGKIIKEETIYVSIYPKIYMMENRTLDLTPTLSIRNTDLVNPIIITSVRYFDGNGKLVRQYLDCSKKLAPLASLELFAATAKPTSNVGASFIVEWAAEQEVNPPIVEAVMLSTVSTQGISFTSVGKTIQNQTATPIKFCDSK